MIFDKLLVNMVHHPAYYDQNERSKYDSHMQTNYKLLSFAFILQKLNWYAITIDDDDYIDATL